MYCLQQFCVYKNQPNLIMKKQILATALMVATFAQAQEGTLDNTFATSGVFKTEENHSASKSVIQTDGKILLCGSKYDANGTDFGIFRHNANGSPDPGFGTNGAVVIDFFGKTDVANGIAVTDGGKILVAGTVTEGTTKKYALVRLNSDGSLDNTFGASGKVVANISGATSLGLTTFTVASNGKIMLGGTADGFSKAALVVFKNTGELDVTFDTDGILQPSSIVEIQSIKLQTDGKILIGGNGSNFATIVRLNSDGSLDNTFGTNGKFINNAMTVGGANTYIDLTPEGKIIGVFGSFASSEVNMLRLTSAGALDTEFGTGGKTTFNAVNGNEYPTAIKVQVNGKVLVIGSSGGSSDLFIARVNADGTLDNTFGTNGSTVTSVREGGEDNALTLAVQSDGKIIVAGNQCGGMCTYILLRYNGNAVGDPTGLSKPKGNFITSIYPNPTANTLQLNFAENTEVKTATVLNLNGQKLMEVNGTSNIDVSELSNGLYFIQVLSNKGIHTQKFIKQ
jgi:uncharacterized delta-60 repeat protein